MIIIIGIQLALSSGHPAYAQFLPLGNPSDTDQLESSFTNPASTGLVDNRLTAGLLIHHAGFGDNFADLKTTFVSYHLPWAARWLEVDGQFFTPDRFHQSLINFNGAYNLLDMLSIGAGVGIGSFSFNRGDFYRVEPGDPVLEESNSKTYFTLSTGVIAWPLPNLMVGASIQGLNRPNISLINDPEVIEPARLSLGATILGRNYRLGIAYVGQEVGRGGTYGDPGRIMIQAETVKYDRLPLLFSASSNDMTAESRFEVLPGLFVSYTFDYPFSELHSETMGSHRLALIWDFDYLPLLPKREMASSIRGKEVHGGGAVQHKQFLYAYGDCDSLYIYQRNFRREANKNELTKVANLLDQRQLDAIYSIERDLPVPKKSEPLEVRDPLLRLEGTYTPGYLSALGVMSARLKGKPKALGRLIAFPGGSQKRAVSLLNYLAGASERLQNQIEAVIATGSGTVPPQTELVDSLLGLPTRESVIDLTPKSIAITVLGVHMSDYTGPWTLVILDREDRPVYEIQGTPDLIDGKIVWDWRLADGSYIPAGEYSLYVRWVDDKGDIQHSSRRFFKVVKRVTTLSIEITRKAKPARAEGDKYQLFISR